MGDFFSKFENFLFDIIGLALPGLIFILLIISPLLFIDIHLTPSNVSGHSVTLSALHFISNEMAALTELDWKYAVGIVFIMSYILGHLVKVCSIMMYDFLNTYFDKGINPEVNKFFQKFKNSINKIYKRFFNTSNEVYTTNMYRFCSIVFKPIKLVIIDFFVFRGEKYDLKNAELKKKCVDQINSKLGMKFPDEWYTLYKFSVAMSTQEGVKSLSSNFLSKYNLYRSLSFAFFITFFYYLRLLCIDGEYLKQEVLPLKSGILIFLGFLWFTFHHKYKRYWTLCGNESLVSLFYFLNKKQLSQ